MKWRKNQLTSSSAAESFVEVSCLALTRPCSVSLSLASFSFKRFLYFVIAALCLLTTSTIPLNISVVNLHFLFDNILFSSRDICDQFAKLSEICPEFLCIWAANFLDNGPPKFWPSFWCTVSRAVTALSRANLASAFSCFMSSVCLSTISDSLASCCRTSTSSISCSLTVAWYFSSSCFWDSDTSPETLQKQRFFACTRTCRSDNSHVNQGRSQKFVLGRYKSFGEV